MIRSARSLFILIFLLAGLPAQSQNPDKIRLNTGWEFLKGDLGGVWEAVRPAEKGRPESVPVWKRVHLPHSFNAYDAVDPDVNYYQGPGWYRTALDISNSYQQGRTLLHFEGAGQKTEVYVYMTKVGSHVGGYDEWSVDITEAVEAFKKTKAFKTRFNGKVPISIRCDNSRDLQMIPSDLSDFNLYGGIYRYLNLVYVPPLSIDKLFAAASVDQKGRVGKLTIRARFYNPSGAGAADIEVRLLDPEGTVIDRFSDRLESFSGDKDIWDAEIKKPALWSPSNPALYTVEVRLKTPQGTHIQTEKVGFRHFEFITKGPFHLNGERLLLKGTHRHEDHAGVAAAMTEDQIRTEMLMMKEMGVNFVRLAHYQQSRIVLDLCDSLGILVWEEIPWCRGGLGGEVYKEQARRMLTNMIEQHYNHPSVIIWGLGNENDWPGDFPVFDKEKIREFMTELNDLAHRLDPSRKTAIRRCDFCKDIVDVYSPSIWAGWYRGIYTEYKEVSKEEFDKVDHFLHVEWGGDSHAGRHSENPDKALAGISTGGGADERSGDASLFGGAARVSKDGDWSESYIVNLIDWHLKEQETMPWLTGTAYWPFKDFSTPVRPDNPVPYMNQKGVVERDFNKKESYYVFQSYWTEKPMAHIYGHSWPVRWGNAGEEKMIKVYSNCDEAELFVNGKSQGIKKRNSQDFPAAGLRWMVPLNEGEHTVRVIARKGKEEVRDEITFQYQTEQWGEPAKMVLEKLTTKNDTTVVQVRLLDKKGVLCLDAANWIRFSLAGDGRLIDNQGTSDGSRKVQLYNGRALISLKTNGGKNVISVQSGGIPTELLNLGSPVLGPLGVAAAGSHASPGDPSSGVQESVKKQVQELLREQVLKEAAWAMEQEPVTVTASVSERSAGGKHDFYSEGDYWWPDPENPEGPYIRRDGMTNPDNFVAHRHAMIRFSRIIGALASAYRLTGDEKYVKHALLHLEAWFTDPETLMNPNLLYAQAIMGRVTGRGIGIIDTIHLIEVAQGILAMQRSAAFDKKALAGIKGWFDEYIKWLTTHPYGKDEMEAENNHGTCWVMQVASFAKLTGNRKMMEFCRERYKNVLLPDQMGADGSFPRELDRTKPYGYSLFNLDAMTMVCQILSAPGDDLWEYETSDGRSIKKGIEFLYPYVADKSAWPYKPDVMYWDNWPVAHPFLVFGANAYKNRRWLETWKALDHSPEVEEVIRNLPVRHPLIWLE